MMTSGLLPFRQPPQPQEILSSWIVRLCLGLGCELQAFTTQILGSTMSLWNGDVDRQVPEAAISGLSRHTGLNPELVRDLTLQAYAGRVFRFGSKSGPLRWVLPVVAHRWKIPKPGLQFCADCMAEDTVPYFRKVWRLAFYTFCPRHQKFMQEGCSACGMRPLPARRDFSVNPKLVVPLHVCTGCLADLRGESPETDVGLPRLVHEQYTQFLLRIEGTSFCDSLDLRFFDHLYTQTRGLIGFDRSRATSQKRLRLTAQNAAARERYAKISPFILSL